MQGINKSQGCDHETKRKPKVQTEGILLNTVSNQWSEKENLQGEKHDSKNKKP